MTRPEPTDPAVDELKRRARRRLVGAAVLALAAAVTLPLLFESEPKPLGDEVSVQIPPIDNNRFVTPLSPAPADGKSVESRPAPKPIGQAARAPDTPAPAAPSATATPHADERATSAASESPPRDEAARAAAALDDRAIAAVDAAPKQSHVAAESASAASNKNEGYVVQVAAYADAGTANTLAAKLKVAGFPGYTEAFATAKGPMRRVRVGPYPTRARADAALAKLKGAGFGGLVTLAH